MMYTKEHFEYMKTPSIIRHVQEMHVKLEKAKKEKRDKIKGFREMRDMVSVLRLILYERLSKMSRYDPKFFPVGSHVEYNNLINEEIGSIKKLGKVVDHQGGFVQVQFEGEMYQVKVDPAHLTLLFIRNKYY